MRRTKQEDYVSFEVAKLLKEKGYNEPSKYYYHKDNGQFTEADGYLCNNYNYNVVECTANPLAEVAKWLREKYDIYVCPQIILESDTFNEYSGENTCINFIYWSYVIYKICDIHSIANYHKLKGEYGTYEEALNEGIKEALKLI